MQLGNLLFQLVDLLIDRCQIRLSGSLIAASGVVRLFSVRISPLQFGDLGVHIRGIKGSQFVALFDLVTLLDKHFFYSCHSADLVCTAGACGHIAGSADRLVNIAGRDGVQGHLLAAVDLAHNKDTGHDNGDHQHDGDGNDNSFFALFNSCHNFASSIKNYTKCVTCLLYHSLYNCQ